MENERSLKQDWSKLSKDQIRDLWLFFTSKIDFRNPVQAYGYVKGIRDNLNEMMAIDYKVSESERTFTRARIHKSSRTLYPSISDLWYPPAIYTNIGRANLAGKPVFYCSDAPGTTIYEVRPNVGDWITTLEVTVEKDDLVLLPLGLINPEGKAFELMSDLDFAIHEFLELKFREAIPKGKEYLYFQTAYFVESFINNKDGVMYPSVGSHLKGWNIAFKPEFIDKYGVFRKATVHEVVEIKNQYEIFIKCHYAAEKLNQFGDFQWDRVDCKKGHLIDESIYHT